MYKWQIDPMCVLDEEKCVGLNISTKARLILYWYEYICTHIYNFVSIYICKTNYITYLYVCRNTIFPALHEHCIRFCTDNRALDVRKCEKLIVCSVLIVLRGKVI